MINGVIKGTFHNRRVVQMENERIRISVTREGGHIAELLEKVSGINPLWIPPWPSIELSSLSPDNTAYGNDAESRLICGIMGHNLCLDMFGPPSKDEGAAGLAVHGEAGVVRWVFEMNEPELIARCTMPAAQLGLERRFQLEGCRVLIRETVENLAPLDRPIAWTQHVTLGPPFLERGSTQFRASATRSRRIGETTDFEWPFLPRGDREEDLRVFTSAPSSGGYTAHLMDPTQARASFWAWSPRSHVLVGYVWNRADFPWMGIWEENCSRTHAPWNGCTISRGMEFGVSPFPETRRAMIDRGRLFDTPCFRWIGARKRVSAEYYAAVGRAPAMPETLDEFGHALEIPT